VAGVTPIGTKLHQRRQQLIERLLSAQNRGDLEAALACFTQPRYELIGNNGDDAVISELWMTGTHLGSGRDFEATGRSFRCRTAVIFGFEGDQLIGARVYYDTGTIARQLA
jgi:SnoaL-like polyketide cyclase